MLLRGQWWRSNRMKTTIAGQRQGRQADHLIIRRGVLTCPNGSIDRFDEFDFGDFCRTEIE